jgi:hypothetical protein
VPIAVHGPEPFLEKTVILFPRAHRIEWQESLAARYSINSGLTADAANECAPPLGAGMIFERRLKAPGWRSSRRNLGGFKQRLRLYQMSEPYLAPWRQPDPGLATQKRHPPPR